MAAVNTDFESRLRQARENVAALDAHDGFKDRDIVTIWSALECGLRTPDTNAHFDALVMIEDIICSESSKRRTAR